MIRLYEAEAGGFEPPVRLPVRQFSKLLVSATHPHFLSIQAEYLLLSEGKGRDNFDITKKFLRFSSLSVLLHNFLAIKS